MPSNTRRKKRKKKPNRSQPLGITDPQALLVHRELSVLRIAGAARPGTHRDELLDRRFEKLEASMQEVREADVVTSVTKNPRKEERRRAALRREAQSINRLPMGRERLIAIKSFIERYG